MNMFDKMNQLIPIKTCLKFRENGDFLIVMNAESKIYYLNDTARFVYENIDGNTSIENIFNMIKKEFEVTSDMEEEVKNDVVSIIRDFQWQKIIELKKISA